MFHWFWKLKYTDCVTTGQFTSGYGFTGDCPHGYQLFACHSYTPGAALDSWYTVSGGTGCYVQADYYENQDATAICCQLRELTDSPTSWPTKNPISYAYKFVITHVYKGDMNISTNYTIVNNFFDWYM